MPSPSRRYTDDRLSLVDLWEILSRRKRWILASILFCVFAVGVYLSVKAPVYEASVRLQIGQVGGGGAFESAEVVSARALSQYGRNPANGVFRPRPYLTSARPGEGMPSVLDFVAQGNTPAGATAFLSKVTDEIRHAHDRFYNDGVASLSESAAVLREQRLSLQKQYREVGALLGQLMKSDPVQSSLLIVERGRTGETLGALGAQIPALEMKLFPPVTQPTRLISDIVAPLDPASPKRVLLLAFAAALGVVVGIVLALTSEAVARSEVVGDSERHV